MFRLLRRRRVGLVSVVAVGVAVSAGFLGCFLSNDTGQQQLQYSHMGSDECAYRPNLNIINDQSTFIYESLAQTSFKYKETLMNDYSYYSNLNKLSPPEGQHIIADNVLVQYMSNAHPELSEHAIVLIHGNSSIPDGFFSNTGSYLNGAGRNLYGFGFDIYAPYTTHNSRFQNSRRRLASLHDEYPKELDVKRIVILIDSIAKRYRYIHLAGVSNGGALAVLAWKNITSHRSDLYAKIGVVLSVEGFHPREKWLEINPSISLFQWNWEMVFPGTKQEDFVLLASMKNVFLALGSCNRKRYEILYEDILHDGETIIHYDGAHEFNPEVFMDAFGRWRTSAELVVN